MKKILYFVLAFIFFNNVAFALNTKGFTDIQESNRYFEAITKLHEDNIIQGYGDGTFQPQKLVNRAEFIKTLMEGRFYGEELVNYNTKSSCFKDVLEVWFAKYICFAEKHNIIHGYPPQGDYFNPSGNITVGQSLKITVRSFWGVTEIDEGVWDLNPYINFAKKNGFWLDEWKSADQQLTRAEMAELIYRFRNKIPLMLDSLYKKKTVWDKDGIKFSYPDFLIPVTVSKNDMTEYEWHFLSNYHIEVLKETMDELVDGCRDFNNHPGLIPFSSGQEKLLRDTLADLSQNGLTADNYNSLMSINTIHCNFGENTGNVRLEPVTISEYKGVLMTRSFWEGHQQDIQLLLVGCAENVFSVSFRYNNIWPYVRVYFTGEEIEEISDFLQKGVPITTAWLKDFENHQKMFQEIINTIEIDKKYLECNS